MTDQITNSGGTITFDRIIQLTISRSCDVALRPVPKRSAGEVLDAGSYLFHPMLIKVVTRLTFSENQTLSDIHEADEVVTLTVGNFTYENAWLEEPEVVYRHSFDGTDDRPYLATLNLYAVSESCSGSFDGNFTHILERNLSKTHKVAIDEFVSTDSTIDSDIWSEKLERLELVVRLTDAEKCGLNSSYWKQTVTINDTIWTYSAWMTNAEFEWDPTNYSRPWLSTLNFIVLSKSCCACSSGEQLSNGGFETGDFTGWTTEGYPIIIDWGAHSGTYCAEISADGSNKIIKTFSTPWDGSCITTFKIWAKGTGCVAPILYIKIIYDDDSTDTFNVDVTSFSDYVEYNILPYVDTTKCISKFEIYGTGGFADLFIDDVTFVGSG